MKSSTGSGCSDQAPALLVVAGPTASGKTQMGIALAAALGGEIISADARQIYRHMDIGTAKPTSGEQAAARHHMIDVVDPDEQYSAARFAREAAAAIRRVLDQGRAPIVVGGSGFYLEALLRGLSPMPEIPLQIRERLREESARDLPELYRRLRQVDPDAAQRLQSHDLQRIVRALEVWEATGERLSDLQRRPRQKVGRWQLHWFGLALDRAELYVRIEARVDAMVDAGLVGEVRALRDRGYSPRLNALNTFGYREIFAYLDGLLSLEAAVDEIKRGTRHYAKRQLTWFRRESAIAWVDPTTSDARDRILKLFGCASGNLARERA